MAVVFHTSAPAWKCPSDSLRPLHVTIFPSEFSWFHEDTGATFHSDIDVQPELGGLAGSRNGGLGKPWEVVGEFENARGDGQVACRYWVVSGVVRGRVKVSRR